MEKQDPQCWNGISKDTMSEITPQRKTGQSALQKGYYLSLSTLMECMNHLLNPHNSAAAVNFPAVARKTELENVEKPYAFSMTGNLAHILWGSLEGLTVPLHRSGV